MRDSDNYIVTTGPAFRLGEPEIDHRLKSALLPGLHEAAPAAYFDGGATFSFLAAQASRILAARPGALIWCRCAAGGDLGTPHPAGLAAFGIDLSRVLLVDTLKPVEALWAAEEAAKSLAAAAIIVEPGVRAPYDLTASRRLSQAMRETGAFIFLSRPPGPLVPTAALIRWRVAAIPSSKPPWNGARGLAGLGPLAWRLAVERLRGGMPFSTELIWDEAAFCFARPAPLADRMPASGTERSRAA